MKNFDLMENQPALVSSSYLYVSKEQEMPVFEANRISVLSNVPEAGLTELMKKSKSVKYVKEEIIAATNNANALVVVFYGKATVADKEFGNETVFHVEESGADFGEIAILSDKLLAASSVTLGKTVFGTISKTDFTNWLINYPDLEFKFIPALIDKIDS